MEELISQAISEFQNMVSRLTESGIEVIIPGNITRLPDSVFPNNWISFHHSGEAVLYPMHSVNRRAERNREIVNELRNEYRFRINEVIDLSSMENEGKFLEGTGSIVFDHERRIAYACLSPRTHSDGVRILCEKLEYNPVIFTAHDKNGNSIYHTNVMMSIGERVAVICAESITDSEERKLVLYSLADSGRKISEISFLQMECMAGNILELKSKGGKNFTVISDTAYQSLASDQKTFIEKDSSFIVCSIQAIEATGGGSVRCMMAEIFCPKESSV